MKRVKLRDSTFGKCYDINSGNCNTVIFALNIGRGFIPLERHVLLPHQVYKKEVEKIVEKLKAEGYKRYELVVIPADTTKAVLLRKKG